MTRRLDLSPHETWVLRWYLLRLGPWSPRVAVTYCKETVRRLAGKGRLWLAAEEGPRGGERLYVVGPPDAEVPEAPETRRP